MTVCTWMCRLSVGGIVCRSGWLREAALCGLAVAWTDLTMWLSEMSCPVAAPP